MKKLTYRLAEKNDYRQTEELTREAFWDLFRPGCDEHLMGHQLRVGDAYIPELDMVAFDGEKSAGHILYTRSHVEDKNGQRSEVISFGPISVLPAYQGRGIGSELIKRTKEIAKNLGYKGIFIYGNPKYYYRFGFANAEKFCITTPDGSNFDDFMGLELYENALSGITGKMFNAPGFEIDPAALAEFEKTFPHKEKLFREGSK
jgi:predicted N-acetyltransferase YhbS